MQKLIQSLIKNGKDPKFIKDAFEFAKEIYGNKKWLGGKDFYIDHTLRMALYLQDLGIDETTVTAALLYGMADTSLLQEKRPPQEEIEKRFGKEVSYLINRTAELNKIYYSFGPRNEKLFDEAKNENLRKMFFGIAQDLRVILLKIASRIDGLTRLDYLADEQKKKYATETLNIFVPVANRLGLGEVKRQLEDLAFGHLYPEKLSWLKEQLKEKYEERQRYIKKFIPHFKKILKHHHVPFISVDWRAKSYWSTYQKLLRHNMNFEKLYDLVALRLIVKNILDCYKALGVIHEHFKPLSGQIQDYIAKPKENGYQSIHTTVFLAENRISEIQIKTEQMHREAMFGIYAHWAYKEKINLAKDPESLKFSQEIPHLLKTFKIDFFKDQIFVFTPKGDVMALPAGSTPVDFAYAVHSDVGNHCEAAKIDGKIIPLSSQLKNGDIVEIITSKKKLPSIDWLRFVKTGFAKSHIKKILALAFNPIISVPTFIGKKLIGIVKKPRGEAKPAQPSRSLVLYVGGQKNIAINFAKCCAPLPGDKAMAYIAKSGPAVLHKVSCKNFQEIAQKFPAKILQAAWQES